ncbi:hypothetical protein L3Y34_006226 [Caenorhabditis briggsae]|uniref:T20D4.11-like domain-containing protein n=2 Tax=Caenorhabditis briggsae TaxID=6238 RepID=A0AAE9CY80_CAEBR|nr:hypothetical protein L3Y34_006226 [Caenorhabditis briggsae]
MVSVGAAMIHQNNALLYFALSCANVMKEFGTKATEFQSQSNDQDKRNEFKEACDSVDDCSENICNGLQNKDFMAALDTAKTYCVVIKT